MSGYIVRQVLYRLATVALIITITFFAMHALPGDPFVDPRVPESIRQAQLRHYGLDQPLGQQYVQYWQNLLQGDLGHSLRHRGRTVNEIVATRFRVSASLGLVALAWSVPVGLALGLLAAGRRGRWPDTAAMAAAVTGIAVPSFVAAALLQYYFAYRLGWFPAARWEGPLHAVLPALALGLIVAAVLARLTRSAALEVLQQPYVLTARAKGISGLRFWLLHVLRNATLPLITVLGPMAASLVAGSLVVERIFAIPGLGRYLVQSVVEQDYPFIMGVTLFYALLIVGALFVVDLLYGWLDPRVRIAREVQP